MPHILFGEWPLLDQYPDPILAELVTRYNEPTRHYHTLAHVRALLSHLSRHQAIAGDQATIVAAILYHDAVYDTRRNDNEARSAELASRDLGALGWPLATIDKVVAMILATQHHNPPQPDSDTLFFLDLDLSILGAQAEHYLAYSTAVRQEFDWVPESVYKQGRSRVLAGFLARETIFRTPALTTLWEENARINLANELSTLTVDPQS
jgi:predicted metal-dependent HD superfamily phosphohydrolase